MLNNGFTDFKMTPLMRHGSTTTCTALASNAKPLGLVVIADMMAITVMNNFRVVELVDLAG
jgi:hypothetical protein